jgi:hypothetical protein
MTWTVKPDAYFSGLIKVNWLIDQGQLIGPDTPYVTNDLTIMVPKNNPAHRTSPISANSAYVWPCRTPNSKASLDGLKSRWPGPAAMPWRR